MLQKKFWIPIVCVLIGVAIGGTFLGKHVTSQEPVKIINPVPAETVDRSQPTPSQTQTESAIEGGHYHSDGTWHADAHQPTQLSDTDIKSKDDVSVEVKARGEHTTLGSVMEELGTDIYSVDINKVPPNLRKQAQYFKDRKEWLEKWERANAEWMQAGRILDNIGPRDAEQYTEYVKNLSEAEKLEHTAKLKNALEKYKEAIRNLDAITQEEPVDPDEEN